MTYGTRIGEGTVYGAPLNGVDFTDTPSDGAWLAEVRIYADGAGTQGIQSVWIQADGSVRAGALFGYARGKYEVFSLDVAAEEAVVLFSNRRGCWNDALTLGTNQGRRFSAGNTSGGGLVVCAPRAGGMVVGFYGCQGGVGVCGLRAIGPLVVDTMPHAPRVPKPKSALPSAERIDWSVFNGAGYGGWRGFPR